jgi:hypothetical protein
MRRFDCQRADSGAKLSKIFIGSHLTSRMGRSPYCHESVALSARSRQLPRCTRDNGTFGDDYARGCAVR